MTKPKYLPQEFEKKLIDEWEKEQTYKTAEPDKEKKKIYTLVMFPYPSGDGLHVGHVRVYTGTDVLARYFRMKGNAVLHPMGWDAFGLPAENAAIKAHKNPMEQVSKNIANFKRQMKMMGLSYDWNRELSTTDPNYYGITQWLFTLFFKLGLLYKVETPVYFCPVCKTGLAEEEVTPEGTHERCGNKITRKNLPQWIFKITDYADSLLAGLKGLDWPAGILEMQKNWIGRKEGINITYDVILGRSEATTPESDFENQTLDALQKSSLTRVTDIEYGTLNVLSQSGKSRQDKVIDKITVFTTRPDTNFGATFVVLAPEHEFVASLLSSKFKVQSSKLEEIRKYVERSLAKTDLERIAEGRKKTGVFTGFYAVNHLTGKLMPVWVSDFVLSDFGTGAVVGVPGHDLRDFEFATQFDIPIIRVVVGKDKDESQITRKEQVQEKEGTMINSGFLNGLDIHAATKKIMDYMEKKGWGKKVVTYHLRDWIFSRQRYWGEPIPMVYCKRCADSKFSWWNQEKVPSSKFQAPSSENNNQNTDKLDQKVSERVEKIEDKLFGWFPIGENELPLKLPYLQHYEPTGTGESPLSSVKNWVETTCPNCGGVAKRETDTMPNWAGSCWYFLAFSNANVGVGSSDPKAGEKTSPLHQNQFLNNVVNSNGTIEQWNNEAIKTWLPVDWYVGGAEHAVLHLLYARFWMHILNDAGLINFREPFTRLRNVGMVLATDHHKMSKSLGNVINPDDVVKEYGADAVRLYEMFMAPFNQEIAWSTQTLQGVYRFLRRIWQTYHDPAYLTNKENEEDKYLVVELQRVINKVSADITDVKYNTAIASMMKFLNAWEQENKNVGVGSSDPKAGEKTSPLQNISSNPHHNQQWNNEAMKQFEEDNVKGQNVRKLSNLNACKFLQLLAPFAPFITEQIWHEVFKEKGSIHLSTWPSIEKVIEEEEVVLPIQVNGKLRVTLKINTKEADEKNVVKRALEIPQVYKWLDGRKYKVVYVKPRILNFVVL